MEVKGATLMISDVGVVSTELRDANRQGRGGLVPGGAEEEGGKSVGRLRGLQ
jgi:hypothetical protein